MASSTAKDERTCLNAPLSEDVGGNLLIRDIAHRLIQSSPAKIPTVLTGPNTSTELTFHSGIKTLGTLYWENMPGLKRAAEIFAATGEEKTKKRLTEAGVTHIVIPSWSNFGEAYAGLLASAQGMEKADPSYLDGVLKSEDFPTWLRPFAYPIPTSSGIDAQSVRIIAFIPEQNAFESWFYRGVYHFESGQPEKARPAFEKALALRPGDPRVLSYLGNLPPPVP
jgi:tetratricopeptide (TPR) repeat protein